MLAINLSEMWPCIFGRYTNIIAAQIHLQCVSIKPSSQIKVTFSFQFQNYLFSTKLSIAEFYEINGLLLLSWTQNILFCTYFPWWIICWHLKCNETGLLAVPWWIIMVASEMQWNRIFHNIGFLIHLPLLNNEPQFDHKGIWWKNWLMMW